MSDRAHRRVSSRLLLELLFCAALALGLLAAGVWQRLSSMAGLSSDWSRLANLLGLRLGGTPLGAEVAQFAAAQLALHVGFGLIAWLFGWLTHRAFGLARERRLWVIGGCFAFMTLWLLIANATLFPWSVSGIPNSLVGAPLMGEARLFEMLSLTMLVAAGWILFLNLRSLPAWRGHGKRVALYSCTAAIALPLLSMMRDSDGEAGDSRAAGGRPNIILIGIDSLRRDMIGAGENPGLTPHIDAFVRDGAQMFTDAITPLARTFPSWTAILSGRKPRATAARENLVARDTLREFDTIADIARRAGYRTLFATDEVRFSNIDESFGFDEVIAPTMGMADFLLGKFNDLPLPNMVANSWLGKQLFPATYGNRAAAVTYRPETFVSWLESAVSNEGPTLLAVHFALPHTPYNWSAPLDRVFGRTTDSAYLYSNAVIAADRQFGELMGVLERKGLLRDALVVFLSDHGEALGLPASDVMLRGAVARELLDGQRISLRGHGMSVLSPHQFEAVLAMRGYGSVDLPEVFREHDTPVSLIDVAPTVLDFAGIESGVEFDGTSLRPIIAGDAGAIARLGRRPRFTESGFRTPRIESGDYDERGVIGDTAAFFRMNPTNARLELRSELMPELLADKERAALSRDWLLASIPNRDDANTQKYVLVSLRGAPPRRLEAPPAPSDADAYVLWQALHEEYAGELLPPATRTPVVAAAD